MQKLFLKISQIFTGKHLCWSLFLIKLQVLKPATVLKKDSNTYVFLCILRLFFKALLLVLLLHVNNLPGTQLEITCSKLTV